MSLTRRAILKISSALFGAAMIPGKGRKPPKPSPGIYNDVYSNTYGG
jgi:hypothetical protein